MHDEPEPLAGRDADRADDDVTALPARQTRADDVVGALPARKTRAYARGSNKPFSSSAAKRQSVMVRPIARTSLIRQALGQIQTMQHFFVRAAVASAAPVASTSKAPPHPLARPMPALGKLTIGDLDEEEIELPPTPLPGSGPSRAVPDDALDGADRSQLSWRDMRERVLEAIDAVCERWGLIDHVPERSARGASSTSSVALSEPSISRPGAVSPALSERSDVSTASVGPSLVLDLLVTTSKAIRTAQAFASAIPPDLLAAPSSRRGSIDPSSHDSPLTVRHLSHATLSTAARPKRSDVGRASTLSAPTAGGGDDRLGALRKTSLDLLGALRDMDVRCRIGGEGDVGASSDPGEGGHLYRSDVGLDDVAVETVAVRAWIGAVDRVLRATQPDDVITPRAGDTSFEAPALGRSSSGSLPSWARMEGNLDPLASAHVVLVAHTPVHLVSLLPLAFDPSSPSDRDTLLTALADGQLLAFCYNAALRQSFSPWGFIPATVHDVNALLAHAKPGEPIVGLTFRRLENLRQFVAAIRLRYGISFTTAEVDVKRIARMAADDRPIWTAMLERATTAWAHAVISEARRSHGAAEG